MGRAVTKLSLIIIQIQTDDDEEKYILQYSRHLNGYNFFEGHIQTNEQPRETAIRALKEATGFREIKKRWGIEFADEITTEEWQKVDGSLKAIAGSYEDEFKLPFISTQAAKNDKNLEKVAHLFLFHLTVDRDKYPKLYERLATTLKITLPDKESCRETSLFRIFTATELLKEAWKNSDNPFLRFAFKKEILKIPHNQIVTLPHIFNITAFETFLEDKTKSHDETIKKDHYLKKNELLHSFLNMHIIFYQEKQVMAPIGELRDVASLIAIKKADV